MRCRAPSLRCGRPAAQLRGPLLPNGSRGSCRARRGHRRRRVPHALAMLPPSSLLSGVSRCLPAAAPLLCELSPGLSGAALGPAASATGAPAPGHLFVPACLALPGGPVARPCLQGERRAGATRAHAAAAADAALRSRLSATRDARRRQRSACCCLHPSLLPAAPACRCSTTDDERAWQHHTPPRLLAASDSRAWRAKQPACGLERWSGHGRVLVCRPRGRPRAGCSEAAWCQGAVQ